MSNVCKRSRVVLNPSGWVVAMLLSGAGQVVSGNTLGAAGPGQGADGLDALYQDLHAHPELSFQEQRTARLLADRVAALGYEVTRQVGRTGFVALLPNGPGPVLMLRTGLDALPIGRSHRLVGSCGAGLADDCGAGDRSVLAGGGHGRFHSWWECRQHYS